MVIQLISPLCLVDLPLCGMKERWSSFSFLFCVLWISLCVDRLSAVSEFNVSGHVGSTVLLPCKQNNPHPDVPDIRWEIESEIVYNRVGEGVLHQIGRYEGRVDVAEDDLHKGNCSLVIHNLTLNDSDIYTSSTIWTHTKTSEIEVISRVYLSVSEKPEDETSVGTVLVIVNLVVVVVGSILLIGLTMMTLFVLLKRRRSNPE